MRPVVRERYGGSPHRLAPETCRGNGGGVGSIPTDSNQITMIDPTKSEIDKFMAEYDAGLHPLSAEDEAALKRAEPEFWRRIRETIYGKPDEQSFSE